MTSEQRGREPAAYQIRVRGHLGPAMRRAFPALQAEARARDTVLRGVTDQAALYGALARIEELGLELLEVRRVTNPERPGAVAGRSSADADIPDMGGSATR